MRRQYATLAGKLSRVAAAPDRVQVVASPASFADLSSDVKAPVDTQEPEVVKGLHHRHTQRIKSLIDGRRDQGKKRCGYKPRPDDFSELISRISRTLRGE